ncbi:MAG: glycosyltransferase [Clostridia bacterium]|nr:glycosyltransferase [Clostridia bacterium]
MKRCLILLTSSYPYQTQESFLESEIPYMQNHFDKIITLAIDVDKNAKKKRAVPENADCYNIAKQKKTISRTQSKLMGAINYVKGSEYSDCDNDAKTPKQKIFLEYFCARAEKEFKLCMDILKKYDFSKYDSITVYSYWFFVAALIGVKIKEALAPKCAKIKLVSRAHGYDVYESVNVLNYLPMRAYLLDKVDAVFPCSIDGENHIKKMYPVFENKIHHSYLGTVECGLNKGSKEGFRIVSCSRAVPLKRLERIVSSLAELESEEIKNLEWVHIGGGPELEKIKALAKEKLGFMSVKFTDDVTNAEVLDFYRKNGVDLFINVSNTEGLPVSIMEVLSFGIPVLATDVGGVSEIVKTNFNGKTVDVDFNDKDLAFEIKKFALADSQERKRVKDNARLYWEQNFNAEKNYNDFAENIK